MNMNFAKVMQTSSGLYTIFLSQQEAVFKVVQLSTFYIANKAFDTFDEAVEYLKSFNDEVFEVEV